MRKLYFPLLFPFLFLVNHSPSSRPPVRQPQHLNTTTTRFKTRSCTRTSRSDIKESRIANGRFDIYIDSHRQRGLRGQPEEVGGYDWLERTGDRLRHGGLLWLAEAFRTDEADSEARLRFSQLSRAGLVRGVNLYNPNLIANLEIPCLSTIT